MLQRVYEQLIINATCDPSFGARLVADPYRAALEEGYGPLVAESLVGLQADSLAGIAAAIHRRIYGTEPSHPREPSRHGWAVPPMTRASGTTRY